MAKFRNGSNDTVLDHLTQQVAKPDEVITVDEQIAELYRPTKLVVGQSDDGKDVYKTEKHAVWVEVAEIKPKGAKESAQ